jgi:thiamine kinase-like enzyme
MIASLPCWLGTPLSEPLAGGLSNEIWKVTDAAGAHVVRFGVDYPFHHVSREREAMTARAAYDAGFAPAVEYTAQGVMVTQFITAQTWDAGDVRRNAPRVADLLRRFHATMAQRISGSAYLFWVFHVVRDYGRTLLAGGSPFAPGVAGWLALNAALEGTQPPLPIVFGHNDLLPANILDDGHRLWLIDYEYAGFSTALFDLAGAASNAQMDEGQATALLTAYFGHPPDATLKRAFDAMQVASLLREAMWAMISALHLSAPGVDYHAYADENLARLGAALDRYQTQHGKLIP